MPLYKPSKFDLKQKLRLIVTSDSPLSVEGTENAEQPEQQTEDLHHEQETDPEPEEDVELLVEHVDGEGALRSVGVVTTHRVDVGHTTIGNSREEQGVRPVLPRPNVGQQRYRETRALLYRLCQIEKI